MATFTNQATRLLTLATPLGDDVLLLTAFSGQEAISQLFTYQLEMVSEEPDIKPADIVGKNVTWGVQAWDKETRWFNGEVCSFSGGATRLRDRRAYRMEVVPFFWYLTRTANCRIFQHQKTPDILETLFKDYGLTDVEMSLKRSYPEWEYCVQYRETAFNFAARLMEHEGIFWFFKHENGKHTLMLADHKGAYKEVPDSPVDLLAGTLSPNHISSWEHRYAFRTGKWAHTDYNFKTPSTNLLTSTNSIIKVPGMDKFEFFDYPGEYPDKAIGQADVKVRMEEEEVGHDLVTAASGCPMFSPGLKFTLNSHELEAENGKSYLITAIQHSAEDTSEDQSGALADYQNSFACIPAEVMFRPPRLTPKPVVQGPQTAVVVGPAGEEIYTDKFGRIKVQFHWDRFGKKDENSSIWMRIAQDWAGKKWGAMYIPRVGHEVVVDFLEGDPDQPVVVGSLYNGENMPHYELPKFKTLAYTKSDSSPGSKGFNELRFEDKKGKEQVFIHSQKRMDVRVLGSLYETCGGTRQEVIGVRSDDKPGGNHTVTVGGDYDLHVKGAMFVGIDKKLNETVKAEVVEDYQANHATMVKAKAELNAREITLEAKLKITLKVGCSFVVIDPSGVTIQGPIVRINSGGAATGTGDPSIEDPLDAEAADTGEPGYLDRPRPAGAGGGGRHKRKLTSQHGLNVTRNADGSFQVGKNISVDGKNLDFAGKAINDLAVLDDTPTGHKVLDKLNSGSHKVKIQELDLASAKKNGALAGPDDPAGSLDPSKGSDTTISYNPDLKDQYTDQNGKKVDVPVQATLGHELIHAAHNADGKNERNLNDPKEPGSNQEESRTIGINDHKDEELSENNILKDMNAGYQRTDHDESVVTPTP